MADNTDLRSEKANMKPARADLGPGAKKRDFRLE